VSVMVPKMEAVASAEGALGSCVASGCCAGANDAQNTTYDAKRHLVAEEMEVNLPRTVLPSESMILSEISGAVEGENYCS
jgi:hypothetical protein